MPSRMRQPRRRTPISNGPSQLKTNLEHSHQFRYTSTSGAATAVVDTYALLSTGVSATSATVGNPVRQSIRINQIEVWSPPASQGAAVTCGVLFPASQRSQAREYTDTSVSVALPAHVKCRPPRDSLCGFWTNGSSATALFTLTAPVGSIIDVWISMVDGDGNAPVDGAVLVGATTGTIYYLCLDSATNATGVYKPVGLTYL